MTVTTHIHLLTMFRMCETIPVLLLHAIMAWPQTTVIMTLILLLVADDDDGDDDAGSNS